MIEAFVWQRRVGFGDCDPALIAYTGRIADFALEALDAFWDDLLDGRGWYHMNVHQGYGMPFVRMEYEFAAPITTKAPLMCYVTPELIGKTSVTMRVEGRQSGRTCFNGRFVSVFTETESMQKISVPASVRSAFEARFPSNSR
ncbi:acyl-CoA thioesterase [Paracoccus versutus]|uniref:acyl-CoA thioesterase n=1 Tax=Paracoccus versutus TaxID=34007 RepID=UPI000DF73C10|nr:thioesterase family protein [Paracoccus versutus]RDD70055.1 acyl-CoA thioesterase [Paracoccus versutus]